jgi:chorismate-pyruvate lyase
MPATALRAARSSGAAEPASRRRAVPGPLHPLDLAYTRAGLEPPQASPIAPDTIPQPYRSLLVHQRDMTLTLEAHFGGRVVLRPLTTFTSGPWYYRRVLLAQEYSGRPVEMGAIRIRLAALPRKVQAEIRRNRIPLGRILRDGGLDFTSMPREFFAVVPNPEMMGVFWMREPRTLYGRRTEVLLDGRAIGDIVEVLPLV